MKTLLSLAVIAALGAGPAFAACNYPKAPDSKCSRVSVP
jgi:hypothetical protein